MAQSLVISALIEKRAEASGRIRDLEERTNQARADLAHVDATLLLFDPEAKPATIRARLPAKATPNNYRAKVAPWVKWYNSTPGGRRHL